MGEVDLPVVSGETSIEAALEAMRRAQRCGLVTARGDGYVVLTDEDLVDAFRERGDRMVAQVKSAHRTLVVSPNIPRHRQMFDRLGETVAVDEILRSNYWHFALPSVTGPVVMVRTIAEAFATALSQPVVVCTCTDDPNHKWRPAQLNDPAKCNLDGYKVNCR